MPTSIPRKSSVRAFKGVGLVAGEAKKMASVMYKFVHSPAMEERRGSLFRTDKVDCQQHHETAKNRPG